MCVNVSVDEHAYTCMHKPEQDIKSLLQLPLSYSLDPLCLTEHEGQLFH